MTNKETATELPDFPDRLYIKKTNIIGAVELRERGALAKIRTSPKDHYLEYIYASRLSEKEAQLAALREALRKAILFGECLSMRIGVNREEINFSYLNEARIALAAARGEGMGKK